MTRFAPHGDRPTGAAIKHAPGYAWVVVQDWVDFDCDVEESRPRQVLRAIARHCSTEDGYGAHPSIARLAAMIRADRKTVMRAVALLEERGELLVRRPVVRARGRNSEYVVVMGRDPKTLPLDPETRPRPRRLSAVPDPAPASSPAPVPASTSAPAPTSTPVDNPRPRARADRSHIGPTSVPHRSRQMGPEVEVEGERRSRGTTSPASPAGEGAGAVDGRLLELADEVSRRGIDVRWDMPRDRSDLVAAAIAVHGVALLADVAEARVRERGTPEGAVAWVGRWTALAPAPAPAPSSPRTEPCRQRGCTSWHTGVDLRRVEREDGTYGGPCPRCHPSVQPGEF